MTDDLIKLSGYQRIASSLLAGVIVMVMVSGCSGNPLPSSQAMVDSNWDTFAEAKQAFDAIELGITSTNELDDIGYGLNSSPNVRILNYLELTGRFMPNPAIGFDQLEDQVRICIKAKTACEGYLVNVRKIKKVREGSVMLDLLNIKRRTRSTGWQFDALLLINKNLVVYKIWGGTPNINEQSNSNNPLGPLQKLPTAVVGQVF
ncbi:MAG: hypothetical protein JKY89_02675 [Immundisolibacteraceae bacterium]|nr:hypothetical protein [Immundisolibacteraceae bacterium]